MAGYQAYQSDEFYETNGRQVEYEENEKLKKDGSGGEQQKPRHMIDLFFTQVDHDLLISKVFYFFFFASFGSLFPLIGIYFKQMGMNATQAGILIGIRPFVEFASAPLWGRFSDRFKRGKAMLMVALLCWILFTDAMGFVHPPSPYCVAESRNGNGSWYLEVATGRSKRSVDGHEHSVALPQNTFVLIDARVKRAGAPPPTKNKTTTIRPKVTSTPSPKYYRPKVDYKTDLPPGVAPDVIDSTKVINYKADMGDLVRPRHSTRVYKRWSVEESFLLLLLIVVIGELFSAPAVSLADGCTLDYVKDRPELYARQRMFGSLGWGLSMFFVGIALDYSLVFPGHDFCDKREEGEKNYSLCFAVFTVLMGCALITATQFRFSTEEQQRPDQISKRLMDNNAAKVDPAVAENAKARAPEPLEASRGPKWLSVLKTFSSPHYVGVLFVAWWMGFGIGLVFAFLFWHLQDIGGQPSLFGLASVVNHISEIFAYFFSFQLINKYGHIKVLYLGLLVNVLRFLYVSWLSNPWWVLPFEFVQGVTHATVWAALSSYISLAAPANYKSSAQGVLQGLHHGFGRGCGTLIGGIVITYTGTQIMFRAYGFICLLVLLIFVAVNKFFKVEGVKYEATDLLEDHHALAPHGIPMNVPYSPTDAKPPEDGYQGFYGAQEVDPTQDAYDKYVNQAYDKPVRFEQLPGNMR